MLTPLRKRKRRRISLGKCTDAALALALEMGVQCAFDQGKVLRMNHSAKEFEAGLDLTFPVVQDLKGAVSVDYGVYGVPETFFLDSQGRIRVKHVGAVTDDVFRTTVDRLLAEAAGP